MKAHAKLASNCSKGAWSLFCWALLPCLSNSPLNISSPWNLIVLNFQVKRLNLTQTKRLPNPVLLLFPHSSFDLAGPSLEEKSRNKIYVPNLDRWTPLQNRHQPKVHILFLGHVYQLLYHSNGNPVNIISSWNQFFVELSNQGQILNLVQKTRNKILDTNVSPGPPFAPG